MNAELIAQPVSQLSSNFVNKIHAMKFKPGDKVKFLNQKGGGVVVRIITPQLVSVAIEDGFEIPTLTSELLKIESSVPAAQAFDVKTDSIGFGTVTPKSEPSNPSFVQARSKTNKFSLHRDQDQQNQRIWLAFKPVDQKWLITGPIDVCLLNPTSYNLIYSLFLRKPDGSWLGANYGSLAPQNGIILNQITRDDLTKWNEGAVQLLFHNENMPSMIMPLHSGFRIKQARMLKEDNYIAHPLIGQRALMLKLSEQIEFAATDLQSEKEGASAQQISNITPERPKALIDRHRIAPFEAEVDLHISALRQQYNHLTNNEIIRIQVDYFMQSLDSAMMNHYRKITFIHGIGNGTLRTLITGILQENEELQVRNAPFNRYGYGAIEVLIPAGY